MRELTIAETELASGGFSTSTECGRNIWTGAVGGFIGGLYTANPLGFAVVAGSGIILGAINGNCFSGGGGDGGNMASYGGDYGGAGGSGGKRHGTVTIQM
ncbi:hypothetical protein [Collimonas humicola]|uniref:hypothetical protein n=1 Tax=Collimonas humicola TaxID=2825886 RepID=UPI001B8B7823|nr:hypothetical protein [Collimonas humicola]